MESESGRTTHMRRLYSIVSVLALVLASGFVGNGGTYWP
jgi:hypothetical protein